MLDKRPPTRQIARKTRRAGNAATATNPQKRKQFAFRQPQWLAKFPAEGVRGANFV